MGLCASLTRLLCTMGNFSSSANLVADEVPAFKNGMFAPCEYFFEAQSHTEDAQSDHRVTTKLCDNSVLQMERKLGCGHTPTWYYKI